MSNYHSYTPTDGHGLPHDPLKAIVAPRPIGWISTVDGAGNANLAPYSFFNLVSSTPPLVMFSSEGWKDTVRNITETKEFCCNLATLEFAEYVNATSQAFEPGINEFERTGLNPVACDVIAVPRIRNCASALECRALEGKTRTDINGNALDVHMVIGQIVKVHILKTYLKDGLFDITLAKTLARAGYRGDYVSVEKTMELLPPSANRSGERMSTAQ